jgi:hypothetical protein
MITDDEAFRDIGHAVLEHTRSAIRTQGLSSLSGADGDRVLAVLSVPAGTDLDELLARVGPMPASGSAGTGQGRSPRSSGASDAATPLSVRRALAQAGEAADCGVRVSGA